MSTRRTRTERISAKRATLIQMQNELKKLEKEEKDAERRARTKRLCRRAGFIESLMPDTITLSDDRFDRFVKKHFANSYGVKILNELVAEQAKEDTSQIKPEAVSNPTKPTQAQGTAPAKAPPSQYIEDDGTDTDEYA